MPVPMTTKSNSFIGRRRSAAWAEDVIDEPGVSKEDGEGDDGAAAGRCDGLEGVGIGDST